jgi:hypothetical protein
LLSQSRSRDAVSIWVEVRKVYSLGSTSSPRASRARTSALAAQADIHAMEDDLLAPLSAGDRQALRRVLRQLIA